MIDIAIVVVRTMNRAIYRVGVAVAVDVMVVWCCYCCSVGVCCGNGGVMYHFVQLWTGSAIVSGWHAMRNDDLGIWGGCSVKIRRELNRRHRGDKRWVECLGVDESRGSSWHHVRTHYLPVKTTMTRWCPTDDGRIRKSGRKVRTIAEVDVGAATMTVDIGVAVHNGWKNFTETSDKCRRGLRNLHWGWRCVCTIFFVVLHLEILVWWRFSWSGFKNEPYPLNIWQIKWKDGHMIQ